MDRGGGTETEVMKSKAPDPAVRSGSAVGRAKVGVEGVGTQPISGKSPQKRSPSSSPRLGLECTRSTMVCFSF